MYAVLLKYYSMLCSLILNLALYVCVRGEGKLDGKKKTGKMNMDFVCNRIHFPIPKSHDLNSTKSRLIKKNSDRDGENDFV